MDSMLFAPVDYRDIHIRNRIIVSPMCQYSSEDGFSNDWHFVHLGSRAVGGAGIVFAEATAVEARGRISPHDLGIYRDEHVDGLSRITAFVKKHGGVAGIQLAHAGRKASTRRPWEGRGIVRPEDGGWIPIAPSAIPFSETYPTPSEMTLQDIADVILSFGIAADRSLQAGFEVIELHAAHGYLIHEFLSPLSNKRTDAYGGTLAARSQFALQAIESIRKKWPERFPLFVRITCTDWADGGWEVEDAVEFAKLLKKAGVDLVDCSSGGTVPAPKVVEAPGYQTHLAERIRREAEIPTAAVGMITSAVQGEHILRTGQADMIVMARELLRDPYWPRRAAKELGATIQTPDQYLRAW